MIQVVARIVSNREVMPETHLIWLESPQIASLAQPGQFVMVRCGEETLLRRPLSVHLVDGGKMALLFAIVGKGSRWLSRRQIGDTLDILGPLGNGFSIHPDAKKLLMVAGGIGIAPLSFLSKQALNHGYEINLLMGAGSAVHLLPEPIDSTNRGLLTDGVLPWGITIHKSTDDGSEGYKGLVTQLLVEQDFIDWADQIFACGPVSMYHDMFLKKRELRLEGKPTQVSLEVRMGCGRGICYACTVKTRRGLKQVCKDGPVFDMDDILWEELNPSEGTFWVNPKG